MAQKKRLFFVDDRGLAQPNKSTKRDAQSEALQRVLLFCLEGANFYRPQSTESNGICHWLCDGMGKDAISGGEDSLVFGMEIVRHNVWQD